MRVISISNARRSNDLATASRDSLYKIFTVPEQPDSTLAKLDQEISENLHGFLQDRIVAVEKSLDDVEKDFSESLIPAEPLYVSDHTDFLLKKLVAHSVHTASPSFIGHMTSALPHFMLPLSKIMIALNQNLVKIETSRAFTPLERQVVGMMHRLVYNQDNAYYKDWMHKRNRYLGSLCSDGTIANITALWSARNNAFRASGDFAGIQQDGWAAALQHYGYRKGAILVSERGHYSISKAADLLGIGRNNIVPIETRSNHAVDVVKMRATCKQLAGNSTRIFAIIGIAGTTETGTVDPLDSLADLAQEVGCHYHVDAAWGGPTLFSRKHRGMLKGIERADSVTIDAHKQLYTPLGTGIVLFKNPETSAAIEQHADYVIRKGSKDLGIATLEGSRPGMALLVNAGLHIIGKKGYELLIDEGIEKARYFARLISRDAEFELISKPQLNILTYRLVPAEVMKVLKKASPERRARINSVLNKLTVQIQKTQRQRGKAFVSRTSLKPHEYGRQLIVVFRVVLANPLTTQAILQEVLHEQKQMSREPAFQAIIASLKHI